MHKRLLILGFLLVIALPAFGSRGDSDKPSEEGGATIPEFAEYQEGVLILQFQKEVSELLLRSLDRGTPFADLPFPDSIRGLNEKFGADSLVRIFPSLPKDQGNLEHYLLLSLSSIHDMETVRGVYADNESVLVAEADQVMRTFYTPNDPFYNFNQMRGLFNIQAAGAWDYAAGSGVVVAIVDSGVDWDHQDLAANIWSNPGEVLDGIDNDGNGYIDDVRGWDFHDGDNDPDDPNQHGTHVAGTVGAIGDNSTGVVGVAFKSTLMPVRGLGANGSGFTSNLVQGMVYATQNGAHVINNSWGGGDSALVRATVAYAHDQGVVVVSAAGNNNSPACGVSPANAEKGITVASVNFNDVKSGFSNFGVKIDVAAPGEGILSTLPNNNYGGLSGTSMAAPHVSGLAALLLEIHPTWTPYEVRQAIRRTADDVAALGFDVATGYGRINASSAVVVPMPLPMASITEPRNCARVSDTVNVVGTADSSLGLQTYSVEIGVGTQPNSFVPLGGGNSAVNGGVLTSFNSQNFADGVYTLRLLVQDSAGNVSEERNEILIDNVYLTVPTPNQLITTNTFNIFGRVPVGNPFDLEWADNSGVFQPITLAQNSVSNTPAFLDQWDLTLPPVPNGVITVRLTATVGGTVSTDEVNVIVDQLAMTGWPVAVTQGSAWYMKSPMVVDLDGDGQNEVVVGEAVFLHTGAVRPGWTNYIGKMGKSNPAVVDVDQDGRYEVVTAVWREYVNANSNFANFGAPVIHAYNADKVLDSQGADDWSFTVENLNTPPNQNHGVPSSISAADVDGDGDEEIVFTVYFNHGNPNGETALFVLDAATGTLEVSIALAGRAMSAVALVDLDDNGAREIVVVSDSNVHVVDGGGAPFSGAWPQPIAGGDWVDPVAADIDFDGDYEILVGNRLWHHDGTAVAGWPTAQNSDSTGALVPLPDGDCNLEVVSGRSAPFVFGVHEDDGSHLFDKPELPANLGVGGVGLNFDRGVPIVADIDGDAEPEIIRPGPRGFLNQITPLYASDPLNPADPQNFPFFVNDIRRRLFGSATVADLDGDGDTEILQMVTGQLYVWDLPGAYDPQNSPWPMFQGDLAHTGTLPRRACIGLKASGSGVFRNSGQSLGTAKSLDVATGDVDGDGDLDAVVGNYQSSAAVWTNNGSGTYSLSQNLNTSKDAAVELEDFDGDGDLDLFVADNTGPGTVWFNNGSGVFTDSGQQLAHVNGLDAATGDFDSDGDLDLVVSGGGGNRIWFNNGSGTFNAGQFLSVGSGVASWGVAVGDLDGDNDSDLFFANAGAGGANTVWLNNGSGTFVDSGQALGNLASRKVALGDFDDDGDLDALVRNVPNSQINIVWTNNGSGVFSNSGQTLGSLGNGVDLGDVDSDGDLDAFFTNTTSANRVWLNDGSGNLSFTNSGQALGNSTSHAASLADVDGDGDLDAFVVNEGSNSANRVWINTGAIYCVRGVASGHPYSWHLGGNTVNHTELGVAGLPAGSTASALAAALVSSINTAGIANVSASVTSPASCLRVDSLENVSLTFGAFGLAPSCLVTPGGCSY